MAYKIVPAATAGIMLLSTVSQTVAGNRALECYKQVHTPAVYETVHETVLVREASQRVEIEPAIYGTQKRRVLISPERSAYHVVPAEYGTVREKVQIREARTVARVIPAVTATQHRKVKVSDGGYMWEWQIIKGQRVLCKVKKKAVYQTVAETVVVKPERVVHERIPAEYGYQTRTVLISAERKERYIIPAEYGYVQEQVVVRAEQRRVVTIPAEYGVRARKVLVSEGSSGWQRVAIPRHCKS